MNDKKIPVVIEQNLSSSVELIPSFKEVSFMFEENSINGEIRFMNYDLAMLSRQSIKLYTDIFIIIGLNNLYKELNTLVAVGASCFSKTESITYLCTLSPTKNDTFIHTFSNEMIKQLNNNLN